MTPRAALVRAFEEGLASVDLAAAVSAALPPVFPRRARVLAVGKAAPAMLAGALARLGPRATRALLVVPDGVEVGVDERVQVLRAAHPLPDARSVGAADAAFAFVRGPSDGLVALVSGGASALLCAPAFGLDLAGKRARVDALIRSGADVRVINAARGALSRIKRGGLARAAAPRPVLTLVASDVLDGLAGDVGSGPTVPAPGSRAALRCRSWIVASPATLASAVAARLRAQGFATRVLPPSGASVAALAVEILALAAALAPGEALVRAAEPTLAVPADAGAGGRSCHLAALVAPALSSGVTVLAAASDGVDGASATAGACVDRTSLDREATVAALAAFATGDLHRTAGTALASRPTGKNFADLHVLARAR